LTGEPFHRILAPQFGVDRKAVVSSPSDSFASDAKGSTLAAIAVIPARFASTRFPGKIIARETGKPLVQHVVDQVRKCKQISRIIVATDDERIVAALKPYETQCVMTDPNHPSGTDRIAEVAKKLKISDPIINVQGDEPEIEPAIVDGLAERIEAGKYPIWTAATPFRPPADPKNPNLVKVVFTREMRAMYFSRAPIPFQRDADGPSPAYHLHIGIYAYQPDMLHRLASWKPTSCEISEKLEQLRALEHDVPIGVMVIDRATHGIDTPEQYNEFVQRYRNPK
jgi:3-deoxy-manno-octulosonate cytidylyltransferase (CMP-KDO synthetase)